MRNRSKFMRNKLYELHTGTPMNIFKTECKYRINPNTVICKTAAPNITENSIFDGVVHLSLIYPIDSKFAFLDRIRI
jgi:hypothetical protein